MCVLEKEFWSLDHLEGKDNNGKLVLELKKGNLFKDSFCGYNNER